MEKQVERQEVQFDDCVLCGKETKEPRGRDIMYRKDYIECVGQLCPECGAKYN